jgi:hypothetical protein
MTYVGFDFSCNKPACCIKKNGMYSFYVWPLELDQKSILMLEAADVNVDNRNRLPEGKTSSEKFRVHVKMAKELSEKIKKLLIDVIGSDDAIISFEGSSFGSKGDAGLQLAGYRYVLVKELGEIYGFDNIYTYAPLTVKSVAGCASKDKKGKDSMITAFGESRISHKLCDAIRDDSKSLKKKTNFVSCIDDISDSFWVLQTLLIKENLS